jgi:hypothetical protein
MAILSTSSINSFIFFVLMSDFFSIHRDVAWYVVSGKQIRSCLGIGPRVSGVFSLYTNGNEKIDEKKWGSE